MRPLAKRQASRIARFARSHFSGSSKILVEQHAAPAACRRFAERGYFRTPGFDRQVFPFTLEGCVVRVSDIISYIGKNMEDAIAVQEIVC